MAHVKLSAWPWGPLIFLLAITCFCSAQSTFKKYQFKVKEEMPVNTYVGSVAESQGKHVYEMVGDSGLNEFSLDKVTGRVETKVVFDRESMKDTSVLFWVKTNNSNFAQVVVTVVDINDCWPVFPKKTSDLSIPEATTKLGTKRAIDVATDCDAGNNSLISYRIVSGNRDGYFSLASATDSLALVVASVLDRETTPQVHLNISACDGGTPSLCGYTLLVVTLIDVNDNSPIFNPSRYVANVSEGVSLGTEVTRVFATDIDLGRNAEITYEIDRTSDPGRLFSVKSKSGVIVTSGSLDYEKVKTYNIRVIARDNGLSPRQGIGFVTVHIIDINDNAPVINVVFFTTGSYQVVENRKSAVNVAKVSVTDADTGVNANTTVWLSPTHGVFELLLLSNPGYVIVAKNPIDREATPQLKVNVIAQDHGNPPLKTVKQITVNVGDENDSAPEFQGVPYVASVNESAGIGYSVLAISATDRDLGQNAQVTYSKLEGGKHASWFSIDPQTGIVRVAQKVDREVADTVILTVQATDQGSPPLFSTTTLKITLLDANDNVPVFTQSIYHFKIVEHTGAPLGIGQLKATDADVGNFARITYSMPTNVDFLVDPSTGTVLSKRMFDREIKSRYSYSVFARDGGFLVGTAHMIVDILDINDNRPQFERTFYNFSVYENTPVNFSIGFINAVDKDAGENATVLYTSEVPDVTRTFVVDRHSGGITPTRSLNYHARSFYSLRVAAQDSRGLQALSSAMVHINVLKANYSPPYFEKSVYNFFVLENMTRGSLVGTVTAKRDNFGIGFITLVILSGDEEGTLTVSDDGRITNKELIDYEVRTSYQLRIQVHDRYDKSLNNNATVNIQVGDVNDNPPVFTTNERVISINEGVAIGYLVLKITADDRDAGKNKLIHYKLSAGKAPFKIDKFTGELVTTGSMDYEQVQSFILNVTAQDQGTPALESSMELKIQLLDVNDNPPAFQKKSYTVTVRENSPAGYRLVQLNVSDVDSGSNGQVQMNIKKNRYSHYFTLQSDGWLVTATQLDREVESAYQLQITAHDLGLPSRSATATVHIGVEDVNDCSPEFTSSSYRFSINEETPIGTSVGRVFANDRDSGIRGYVTYTLSQAWNEFSIDAQTGIIRTGVRLDREKQGRSVYSLIVVGADGGIPSRLTRVEVKIFLHDINDNRPTFDQTLPYVVTISEHSPVGTSVLTARATDSDLDLAGTVVYSVMALFPDEQESVIRFKIDPQTGIVTTRTSFTALDGNAHSYALTIVARDSGKPILQMAHKAFIFIVPGPRLPTLFTRRGEHVFLPEAKPANSTIFTVMPASAAKVSGYRIIEGNVGNSFHISSSSGQVSLQSGLRFKTKRTYMLNISATNDDGKTDSLLLCITVLGVNSNWPVFTENPIIKALLEDPGTAYKTKHFYSTNVTDPDFGEYGKVMYFISLQGPGSPVFRIDAFTGEMYTTGIIDREETAEWTLTLTVTDLALDIADRKTTTATMKIIVIDRNDNPPLITSRNSSYMMEDEEVGYPVMRIFATDPDEGMNADVTFGLSLKGNEGGHFTIDKDSGEVTLNKTVAHQLQSKYNLLVLAEDSGSPPLSSSMPLEIAIIDVNNDRPKFSKLEYRASIEENSPIGATIIQVVAYDVDTGLNGKISYSLQENTHFVINEGTGIITTKKQPDREKWAQYTLSVSAQDSSYPFYSNYASVIIDIIDVNDSPPSFLDRGNVSVQIYENSGPTLIHTFFAGDDDVGKNAEIVYKIVSGDRNRFEVNAKTGQLSTITNLDREVQSHYELRVEASNTVSPFGKAYQYVTITVLDVNDENPTFERDEYKKVVPEDLPTNTTILTVRATDKDSGANGRVVYSIPGNSTTGVRGKFDIHPTTGAIVLISPLDYEDASHRTYYFQVRASDQAKHGARHTGVQVMIEVTDVNDNVPVFTKPVYESNSSGLKDGKVVLTVEATDLDSGSVKYSFEQASQYFTIEELSGNIRVAKQISPGLYKMRVKATDAGIPPNSNFAVVLVNVGQFRPGIPKFLNKSVPISVRENLMREAVVCTLYAQTSSHDKIKYSLVSHSNPGSAFKIDEDTGVIRVNNPDQLDYETRRQFLLGVLATVAANVSLNSYTMVQILLLDENDNAPVISPSTLDISLPEATGPINANMYIFQFTATDKDSGSNGKVTFEIISGNETGDFYIHPEDGVLVLRKPLDYERKKSYRLKIRARDHGNDPLSAISIVTINVENKNDNPPTFLNYSPAFISELTQVGQYVYVVQAKDGDEDSTITYGLSKQGEGTDTFSIDPKQGTLQLIRRLDYEEKSSYRLVITASDGVYETNTTLTINVTDENDNQPRFSLPGYYVYLPETIPKGHLVTRVNATDKDSGIYGKVRYSLGSVPLDAFVIDQDTGVIWTTKKVELDPAQPPLELTVVASDSGDPARVDTASVRLRVRDPNYSGPRFLQLEFTAAVSEDARLGSVVITVRAVSSVKDMYIRYQILSGNIGNRFDIDSRLGRIYVSGKLDRETWQSYKLVVEARDNEKEARTSQTSVLVNILDANDNSPMFPVSRYTLQVYENVSRNTELLYVNATDADDPATGNGKVSYRIVSGNSYNWFQIDSNSGMVKVARLLDRETLPLHRLTVEAADGGTPSRSTPISVVVKLLDVNDNAPEFRMDSPNINDLEVRENQPAETLAFKAKAEDPDEGSNSLLTYSIIGGDGVGYFRVDNETGWIYTTAPLDYEEKNLYKLLIQAVDHGTPPLNGSFEYRVAVRDENEFAPFFRETSFSFSVKGTTSVGSTIGQVKAFDQDGGEAGKVFYSFVNAASDALKIDKLTGTIVVNTDLRKRIERRKRRATDSGLLVYVIRADNGPNTTAEDVPLTVSVDYSCPGCTYIAEKPVEDGEMKGLALILVTVFAAVTGILLLGIIIFVLTVWKRRKRQGESPSSNDEIDQGDAYSSEDHLRPVSPEREPLQQPFTKYRNAMFPTERSATTSSGRGSSESQLLEDHPVPSVGVTDNASTHSFVVYQEKPILDSGIQQDFDHLSDVTISDVVPEKDVYHFVRKSKKGLSSGESHESLKDFKDEGGGEAAGGMDVGNLLYAKLAEVDADEQEAIMDGTRPFQEEGAPSHGGSLSTIVGSEEELRGSYNWDYLLDWGPQFQPLAAVFSEIAKMKDANGVNGDIVALRKAPPSAHVKMMNGNWPATSVAPTDSPKLHLRDRPNGVTRGPVTKPHLLMPSSQPSYAAVKDIVLNGALHNHEKREQLRAPLVEDVMPVDYKEDIAAEQGNNIPSNMPSNFISNRTSLLSSVTSLPQSPLSVQSAYTPGPLSPNFTPVITPLITRSPSVSPLGTPEFPISPARSNAASVLDIAGNASKRKKGEGSTISQETPVTLSDLTSEIEIEV